MANVQVVASGNTNAGNRQVHRTSSDRVYVVIQAGANIKIQKGNQNGEPTSFSEVGSFTDTDIVDEGAASCIDGNNDIHIIWYKIGSGHGAVEEVRYARFDTGTDTFDVSDEKVVTLDNADVFTKLLAIAVDANNDPHVAYLDEISDMGGGQSVVFYINRIGGDWTGGRVEVDRTTAIGITVEGLDIMVADPASSVNADRPIIVTNGVDVVKINAFHGTALDATAFTEANDITGTIAPVNDPPGGGISIAIDSNEKITVAFIERTTLDLMIVEHLNSNGWNTWETPTDVDTSRDYANPSIVIDGTSRYIFAESTADNDIRLWKNENLFNTFFFDTFTEDPDGEWTDDANAFDGNTSTNAKNSNNATGSTNVNELRGKTTSAPASGATIDRVTARAFCDAGGGGERIDTEIHTESQGELLATIEQANIFAVWTKLFEVSVPTGGWTYDKLQKLEASTFRQAASVAECTIARTELIVETGVGWVEETADTDLPNVGTFNDVKTKWSSKNNNSPADLDYVFEDSGGAVQYNTFDAAGGVTNFERTASQIITISHTNPRALVLGRTAAQTITHLSVTSRVQGHIRSATQTITHSSSVSRAGSTFARTIAQSLTHSSVTARLISFSRIVTQTITHIDSVARAGSTFARIVTQTITHSSIVARVIGFPRTVSQTITHSESVVRQGVFNRTVTQNLTHSSVITRIISFSRAVAQAITESDVAVRVTGKARTATQIITESDSVTREYAANRTASQILTHSSIVTRTGVFVRTVAQSIIHSSVTTRLVVYSRIVSQILTHSESISRAGSTFVRTISQTLTHSSIIARTIAFSRSVTQTITHSSIVTTIKGFLRSAVQIITHIDSVVREGIFSRTVSQSLTHSSIVTALKTPGGGPPAGGKYQPDRPRLKQIAKIENLAVGRFGVRFKNIATSKLKATSRHVAISKLSSLIPIGESRSRIQNRIENLAIRKHSTEINHLAISKLHQEIANPVQSKIKTRITEVAHSKLSTKRKRKKKLRNVLDKLDWFSRIDDTSRGNHSME